MDGQENEIVKDPEVSVCVATYNGERYIECQLRSILSQLGPDDEVVVSDDGSTDGTLAAIRAIGDSRIRIVYNKGKHCVNGNFENSIRHSRGKYIFLSDQDDCWIEGKVEKCLEALREADLVVHDAIITDSELRAQNKTLFLELDIKEGFISNFVRNRFTGCCMAFRRDILSYILPIPTESCFYHDNWIGLMTALKGKVRFLPFEGIYFRRHPSTNSIAGSGKGLPLLDKIRYRARLGYNILKRYYIE